MVILAGGCVLFGEAMPPKKLAGVVLGMCGILWCAPRLAPSPYKTCPDYERLHARNASLHMQQESATARPAMAATSTLLASPADKGPLRRLPMACAFCMALCSTRPPSTALRMFALGMTAHHASAAEADVGGAAG